MVKLFGYKTAQSSVYRLNYHFAWSTKLKLNMITQRLSLTLRSFIKNICQKEGYELLSLEIFPNNVQMIVGLPPKESPSTAIKKIKGITARKILLQEPELKHRLLLGSFWNNNYFVGTVGRVSEESIDEYIAGQKSIDLSL
jgi:putative transposase